MMEKVIEISKGFINLIDTAIESNDPHKWVEVSNAICNEGVLYEFWETLHDNDVVFEYQPVKAPLPLMLANFRDALEEQILTPRGISLS